MLHVKTLKNLSLFQRTCVQIKAAGLMNHSFGKVLKQEDLDMFSTFLLKEMKEATPSCLTVLFRLR